MDVTFQGGSHTGIATAAFIARLSTRLPHLMPLALVLKQFLRLQGLSDPEKGGLPCYGLILMITFLLLRSLPHLYDEEDDDDTRGDAVEMYEPSEGVDPTHSPDYKTTVASQEQVIPTSSLTCLDSLPPKGV